MAGDCEADLRAQSNYTPATVEKPDNRFDTTRIGRLPRPLQQEWYETELCHETSVQGVGRRVIARREVPGQFPNRAERLAFRLGVAQAGTRSRQLQ